MTNEIDTFKIKRRGPKLRRVKGNGKTLSRRRLLFKLVVAVWLCVIVILFLQMISSDKKETEQIRFLARTKEKIERITHRKDPMPNTEST